MPEFRRPQHQLVARVLQAVNGDFLAECNCYFGGGTQLALMLDEYRESRDIDFLCSSRAGFKEIRETVRSDSLGQIFKKPLVLAREVRADRDGVRTFFAVDGERLKFEILFEARIDLEGGLDKALGVPTLDLDHAVAEKFLSNADRGLDDSTHARDVIDLAHIAAHRGIKALMPGLDLAQTAYGSAIREQLRQVLAHLRADKHRLQNHAAALGIEDTRILRKGLKALAGLLR